MCLALETAHGKLVDAFKELVDNGATIALAVIGDGPYRQEMEAALAAYPTLFTGLARMGGNARRFTLANAPDSSQTYSTILHIDAQHLAATPDFQNAQQPEHS